MAYAKGESGNPAGRPRGAKNRSTSAIREMLLMLVENNLDNMSDWLVRMGQDDPKAAFQCMLGLMEFHIPKMSRSTFCEEKEAISKPTNDEIDAYLQSCLDALEKEGYGLPANLG